MTAGFEKGGFTADQTLPCGGSFDLGSNVYHDWNPTRHTVTYKEGLVQSCDVVFYTVGKKLDDTDPNILPTYARHIRPRPTDRHSGCRGTTRRRARSEMEARYAARRLVNGRCDQPLDRSGIPACDTTADGEHLQQHRERRHDLAAAPRLPHPQRGRLGLQRLSPRSRKEKSRPQRRILPSCSRRSCR